MTTKNTKKRLWLISFMMAIAFMFMSISSVSASSATVDNPYSKYSFGTALQYKLLQNSDMLPKDVKVAGITAPIGNGAVRADFSYNGIYANAPAGSGSEANRFSTMMATYSTYNYMTTSSQGSGSLGAIGRFILGIVLLPMTAIGDASQALLIAMVNVAHNVNVISIFAGVFSNSQVARDFATAIGVSVGDLKKLVYLMLWVAVIVIGISLARLLITSSLTGKFSDGGSKFRNRMIMVLIAPAFAIIAGILVDTTSQTLNVINGQQTVSYQSYFVDDESWAKLYNFAPVGGKKQGGDFAIQKTGGSYVDRNYNPYTSDGANRVKDINDGSPIISQGKGLFGNTSFVLGYMMGGTFSADDWLEYQGSEESATANGGNKTFGSYYAYTQGNQSNYILNTDKLYYATGDAITNNKGSGDSKSDSIFDSVATALANSIAGYVTETNFSVAKDDYSSRDLPKAWRERFVFGSKSDGANFDKYYKKSPSIEQLTNTVGTGSAGAHQNSLSDQSMYLALSTTFNDNGGHTYLKSPAKGLQASLAVFDSDRTNYYKVSMVGNPMFTAPAVLGMSMIHIIIVVAGLIAVVQAGIIEINVRAARSYLKGLFGGVLEFGGAFIMYAMALVALITSFLFMPQVIEALFTLISNGAEKAVNVGTGVDISTMSVGSGIAMLGFGLLVKAGISMTFFFMFWKNKKFRDGLINMFLMLYNMMSGIGQKLETQGDSYGTSNYARRVGAGLKGQRDSAVAGANNAMMNTAVKAGKVAGMATGAGAPAVNGAIKAGKNMIKGMGNNGSSAEDDEAIANQLPGKTLMTIPKGATLTETIPQSGEVPTKPKLSTGDNAVKPYNPADAVEDVPDYGDGKSAKTSQQGSTRRDTSDNGSADDNSSQQSSSKTGKSLHIDKLHVDHLEADKTDTMGKVADSVQTKDTNTKDNNANDGKSVADKVDDKKTTNNVDKGNVKGSEADKKLMKNLAKTATTGAVKATTIPIKPMTDALLKDKNGKSVASYFKDGYNKQMPKSTSKPKSSDSLDKKPDVSSNEPEIVQKTTTSPDMKEFNANSKNLTNAINKLNNNLANKAKPTSTNEQHFTTNNTKNYTSNQRVKPKDVTPEATKLENKD